MILRLHDHGLQVKEVQEWLNYWGYNISINGEFDTLMLTAIKMFQKLRTKTNKKIIVDGIVGDITYNELISPIIKLNTLPKLSGYINTVIAQNARRHLEVKPKEIGGENMGPFVRYYMRSKQGATYPWCAGFVSTIVEQSFKILNIKQERFNYRISCDELLKDAEQFNTLVDQPRVGNIFLIKNPSNSKDCIHTGIVIAVEDKTIGTVEGNTNSTGSREGYEACIRTRAVENKYFIDLGRTL